MFYKKSKEVCRRVHCPSFKSMELAQDPNLALEDGVEYRWGDEGVEIRLGNLKEFELHPACMVFCKYELEHSMGSQKVGKIKEIE